MKKLFLLVTAIMVIGFTQTQAQLSLEIQFKPLGQEVLESPVFGITDLGGSHHAYGISPRYLITDEIQAKVDLFFGMNTYKEFPENDKITETTKDRSTIIGINLGANVMLQGTAKVTPYAGASIMLGSIGLKKTVDNANFEKGDYYKHKGGYNALGFAVSTGFNWAIVDGLYIGAEIGLGFMNVKPKTIVTETKPDQKIKDVEPTKSANGINFFANPAIRLGWNFNL